MENTRGSFSDDLKWNTNDLYHSRDDFERDYALAEKKIKEYEKFKGHVLDDAATLLEMLDLDEEICMMLDRIYIYAHTLNDQDTRNTECQTLYDRAVRLYEKVGEASSYIVPELIKKDYSVVEEFIGEEAKLKHYELVLKNIFRKKKYVLSDIEEQLISNLTSVFSVPDDVYSLLSDADMKFGKVKDENGEEIELNEQTYHRLIMSFDRDTRRGAFQRLYEVYGKFKNTFAKLLASEVNVNNKIAKIRGYNSALEASLYGNDVPKSIIDNLIATVKKNVAPLSKYWVLKSRLLGVDELHLYDTLAPTNKESNKKYTYEEAKETILETVELLGEDYTAGIKRAFEEGWVDSVSNDGKRGGAYCTACYGVHPYVLLSFDGTLSSVSTLIHELGHAMHYHYAMSNQSFQDFDYSIFVAEVASQVNQILLTMKLIEKSCDPQEKIYLLNELATDFKSSIYRQTMFADYEVSIHEMAEKGEVLTHEVLEDLYFKLNKEYNGENIVIDDEIRYEWERVPHFYMNFYVYQYATAYAASIIIAKNLLARKPGALESYLEFLKLGKTKTPVESLKVAGVDMESEKTLEEAFEYFDDIVRQLEENMRC